MMNCYATDRGFVFVLDVSVIHVIRRWVYASSQYKSWNPFALCRPATTSNID